jgi:hypothetical protein
MKKIFSLIAAVLFAGSMMADSYVKVTKAPTDWTGDYLIVYEEGSVAFDGSLATLDAVSNTVAVTISEGAIAATDALNASKFTIAKVDGGYSLQAANGKFIGVISNSNGLKQADAVGDYTHDLSIDESGNAVIKANFSASTMHLRYNKASNQTRFRYYKNAGQEPIALYKLEADAPAGDIYTVAGEPTTVFGTTWDLTNTANDMAKQTDGSYKWEKTGLELGAGTVAFKVVKNRDWNNGANAWPAENYTLAIAEAGIYTITITFEPANENAVNATATKTGEAVVVPTVVMHGNFTGSWADTEAFAKAEDKKTASLKLTLAVGDIEFGLKLDGSWKANGATITRENASTSLASGSGNMHLTADVAGEYTFTYTYETQTLAVTFPALPATPISLTDFIANKPTEEVTLKDLTVIFASGSNTYVIDADGVALVIYDKNKTYYDGTLTAGKVLSGQKATYTVYNNQDEIIPTNAAAVSDGTAPEAEARTEAPTVADVNKYLSFKKVEAKVKDGKYYIFDGAVLLYGATSSLKPTEDGKYDLEGLLINFKGNQLELIVTAIKKSSVDPIPGDEVELNITKGVMFTDAVEEEGWWQVRAMNDHYFITLSNAGEIAAVAGTYTAEQLDEEFSYVNDLTEEVGEDGYTNITFTAGSVTVAVAQDGKVSFVGTLTGSDAKTYKINIVYTEPKAEETVTVTAEGELKDYIESMGGFLVGAQKDNVYVQVFIYSDQIAGEYTVADLEPQYSYIQLGEDEYAEIYSATIKVVANADGSYTITADVLCYGDVLYKITVTIPGEEPTAIDNATIAGKIRKAILNGNVVIEKDNTLYNVNGAIVR